MYVQLVCLCQAQNLNFSFKGQGIIPARIFLNRNQGKLQITCSTHGLKETKNSNSYIYLCRNGIGIDMKSSCQDATFYVDDNTNDITGNYSCVFSERKHNTAAVRGKGINSIFVLANGTNYSDHIIQDSTLLIITPKYAKY